MAHQNNQQFLYAPGPPSPALSATPPPSYISRLYDDLGDEINSIHALNQNLDSLGVGIRDDGRLDVDCHAPLGRRLSRLLGAEPDAETSPHSPYHDNASAPPRLNIVIQVSGSRGDVQPFVALGCALQSQYGHRVRLATHATFETFVRSAGLEFSDLGGDPTELMAYIVKNPGLIPSFASLKAGDIGRKREMLGEMLEGCWKSCIQPDELTHAPFVADAIIANPPSMGHVHCAQALSVPLHIMFTMPWSTTRAFPHPLANLNISPDTTIGIANSVSFGVVEFMMWQGVGDLVNRWRSKSLNLEPIPESDGPKLLERLEVPHTYCWSPSLVPRPSDWPQHIDVCGFFFREPPSYRPPPDLAKFLTNRSTPIYIGFGSIVVDDSKALTDKIMHAIRMTGVRALISRGWSNLGQGYESDDTVFFLDDCPHEWLFSRVSAVVHHGGAGTTACGLANGKPTLIVPFFGDQPFWGNMVASTGSGPAPIPYKELTVETLARSITQCLEPKTKSAAEIVAAGMRTESGISAAIKSFHAHLPRETHCQALPNESAAWTFKSHRENIRVSKKAASALVKAEIIQQTKLIPFNSKQYFIETKRSDPVSAILSASFQTLGSTGRAATGIVLDPLEAYKSSKTQDTGKQEQDPLPLATTNRSNVARQLACASARSTGRLLLSPVKGIIIDIPMAAAEGMRALPRLYGDRTYSQRKPITDWKSGSLVGAKSFADGVRQGTTDIFTQTYSRKKKEGAIGVAKGLSIGLASFTAKTGAAAIGLVAYPCQGVYRSLHAATHTTTRDLVNEAKHKEGQWLFERESDGATEAVQSFLRLRSIN